MMSFLFFRGGVQAHKINTTRNKFSNTEAVGGPVFYCAVISFLQWGVVLLFILYTLPPNDALLNQ